MKKLTILILGLWLATACNQSGSEKAATKSEEALTEVEGPMVAADDIRENRPAPTEVEKKGEKVDFDFLTECDALETWQGAIQGVEASGNPGIYVMGQCASNRHYDVIVHSNNNIKLGDATDTKSGDIREGLSGATYYAFEIPKKEAVDPEDEFETFDYVFPSEVRVYQRFEDGWYLINRKRVNSFEELGSLKLNTIQQNPAS
ncbi:hypothetical protein [Cesiribacter sp. SM1]|uniref:hypothetical protein n=1 Tax=Cesiribacter sp. SM1 TaxID=2861196 RepID=UPI001CD24470|nr:hypothetical protein [Cesiribacter sp. SM1]